MYQRYDTACLIRDTISIVNGVYSGSVKYRTGESYLLNISKA